MQLMRREAASGFVCLSSLLLSIYLLCTQWFANMRTAVCRLELGFCSHWSLWRGSRCVRWGWRAPTCSPGPLTPFSFAKLYLALTLLILGVLLIWHEPNILTCSKWRKPSVQGLGFKPPHQTCSSPSLAPALPSTLQPYVLAQDSLEWHRQEMSVSDS